MKTSWKVIGLWTGTCTILIAGGWLATRPLVTNLLQARSTASALNDELTSKKTYKSKLEQAGKNPIVDSSAELWKEFLPKESRLDVFTVMLEDLGKSTKINQATISFDKAEATSEKITFPTGLSAKKFTISGSGSYESVLSYFDALTKVSRFNRVTSFTLLPGADTYTFTVNGFVFSMSPKTDNTVQNFDFIGKIDAINQQIIKFNPLPADGEATLGRTNPFGEF